MRWRGGAAWWAVAVLALAACGDGTGVARDFDPYVAADQFGDVLAPMADNEGLLLSLDLAVVTLEWYHADGLAAALAVQRGVAPGLLGAIAGRRGRGRISAAGSGTDGAGSPDRRLPITTDGLAPAAPAPLYIPSSIRGRTLVWDPVEGYVPVEDALAPATGVRLALYRMDPYSGYPAEPLSQIGVLDILDEDHSGGERVRIEAVRTAGPNRVIADYAVELSGSGTSDEGEMRLDAEGRFGDETSVELELSEIRNWSRSNDRDELRMDYSLRRGGSRARLAGLARSTYEGFEWDTFDFEVAVRGGGPDMDIDARVESDASLWGEIRSDGQLAIRVGGYDGRPSFERPGGRLSQTELEALDQVWTGISDLLGYADWLLVPQELLLLDG